ncbi:MAG TPA: lysoplasmalogenase [Blastocatellia bacterium]|nr:lysoplasmalogenase [Blastocatellia bacterium]
MSFDSLTFGHLRRFGAVDRALLLLSIICSFFYLVTQGFQPFPGSILLKILSIAPLAVIAFRALREPSDNPHGVEWLRDRDNVILGMALAFSSLGDALLDLDPEGLFIRGLLSFLVAHFIYILLFVRNWIRPLRPQGWQLALQALVLIYSMLMSHWLAPSLGAAAAPVMLYVCVLTVMVASAILAVFSKPWVYSGAILFLISDSILAINKFKSPVPLRGYLVWATYYLAQYGIAIGFLREKLSEKQ